MGANGKNGGMGTQRSARPTLSVYEMLVVSRQRRFETTGLLCLALSSKGGEGIGQAGNFVAVILAGSEAAVGLGGGGDGGVGLVFADEALAQKFDDGLGDGGDVFA